jgi:hypothetical protein
MMQNLIIFFLIMGMFSFVYIALNAVVNSSPGPTGLTITDPGSTRTASILMILWTWWPVAVLFAGVVYLIDKASKQNEVYP